MSRFRPAFIKPTRTMAILAFAALLSVARGFRYDEVSGEKKVATSILNLIDRGVVVWEGLPTELDGPAQAGFEKLEVLAKNLLAIMAQGQGAEQQLREEIRSFIDSEDATLEASYVYQTISTQKGTFASVAATPAWASILDYAFEKGLVDPTLANWKKSTNSLTGQWAYVLEVPWAESRARIFAPDETPKFDARMLQVEQDLQAKLPELLKQLGVRYDGTVLSFLVRMYKYSSPSGTGGWQVRVHTPAYEIDNQDNTAKKNELRVGTGLVADLIVLSQPEMNQPEMKVGWNEDYGRVSGTPNLRVLPSFMPGEDDETRKAKYFSSMFQVGNAWDP